MVAEGSYDLLTSGLWAHHASTVQMHAFTSPSYMCLHTVHMSDTDNPPITDDRQ